MTRAFTHEDVARLRQRVHDIARGAALMTGTTLEIEEDFIYAERLMVPELQDVVLRNLDVVGVPRPDGDPQSFASADSGNVSQLIPHVTFSLPLDELGSVPHTAEFAEACNSPMAYDALITAAKIMAVSAIDLLTDPEQLERIKRQHAELKAA